MYAGLSDTVYTYACTCDGRRRFDSYSALSARFSTQRAIDTSQFDMHDDAYP